MCPAKVLGHDHPTCRSTTSSIEFHVGSGFTEKDRVNLWHIRETLLGKTIKFKFQPDPAYELPRMPIFLGFRSKLDL